MAAGGLDTRDALDAASMLFSATDDERRAIRRYQSADGTYHEIDGLLRGDSLDPAAARRHIATVRHLDALLRRSTLPLDVVVYRGLADASAVVPLHEPFPRTRVHSGYLSTSLARQVATEGFTAPGDASGLLRIVARRGVHAVWVPPLGSPGLADEQEVLFPRGTFLTFHAFRVEDSLVTVDCEVVG